MDGKQLKRLIALGEAEAAAEGEQVTDVAIDRTLGLDYAHANRLYYGTSEGPITPQTVGSFESVTASDPGVVVRAGADMGFFPAAGGQSVTVKVTLCINNGRYGRAESHHLDGVSTPADQDTAANLLAKFRAQMLGSSMANGASTKNLGNPKIEFIKIS